MAGNFSPSVGSCVWVEDRDEAWIDGEVVEVNGEDLKVLCTSGKHVVTKASAVYPKDTEAPASGVDDMTRLAYLHEPGVLQNLHSRYDINEIYTYTGSILIAVNPFRRLPHLYSSHMMAQYKGAALGELSPHPFAVADAAYSTEEQVVIALSLVEKILYFTDDISFQDAIFSVVAAILHLGNVEFAKGAEIDSSVPKDEKSLFHLKTAAELLSCDEKALEDSLCKRIMVTRDETITKTLDPEAATLSRDALAKVMYSRLFDWLVDKINSSIGQDPHSKYLIGVLDIYGFESFKTNSIIFKLVLVSNMDSWDLTLIKYPKLYCSFEQFCINLTNEKLQQHFNQHVFKMEQEEYKKEEINWSYIEFVDNQDILDLIEKEAEFTTPVAGNAEKSAAERQIMDADALIDCVKDNIGFSNGKPVAAFTIYKCLLHWKCFESEKTNVFDRLIQMIGSAIENEDDNSHLAYWLTSTSALLFLLQKSLKTGGSGAAQSKKPPTATSLFGRMAMSFRSSPASGNLAAAAEAAANAVIRPVEAKYPALLFKQQLAAYVEKMFGMVRDNLKKELSTLLSLCIQAPRTSKGGMLRSGRSFGKDSPATHWQSIIDGLNSLLVTLKENHVPLVLIQKIYSQTFSFINVQLFNSLLLRKECCTFSNGEFVKAGLAELELWCCQAKEVNILES
ncbi:hypothetical protein F2Q70_00001980 [Brassica cretica]|uniref:Myosin motor domain-containing protein n=1 Tax=Brassica cretica TaxID=69181 RepID=A0A8S9IXX4_BRACR|nr:hypothetical protein F2Q70_00001980 [Brassica cretica]